MAAECAHALELVEQSEQCEVGDMLPVLVVVTVRDVVVVPIRPVDLQVEPTAQLPELGDVHDVEVLQDCYQDYFVCLTQKGLAVLLYLALLDRLELRLEVL